MAPSPWIFLLIVAVLAAFGIYAWRRDQARQEALRTWAFGRGWRTWPGGEGGPLFEHPGLTLLERGHSRRCGCLIRGNCEGLPLNLFDYRYVTGHGKNRTTHRYAVAVLVLPFPVRALRIRPENAFDKVGELFGAEDINFESAEFSRRYHVAAADRKWAYDIIHARMMEYLLNVPGGWALEMGSHELAAFRRGYADVPAYEAAIDLLTGVRERIPEYVIRQQRGEDA